MNVGFIGAGSIATALASHLARARHDIILSNSRGPATLTALAARLGSTVRPGTTDAAASAELVVLSVPWVNVEPALAGIERWDSRILVDTTNAVLPGFRPADLDGRTSSEVVASLAPGARVVKAFNTLRPDVLATDPRQSGGRRVIFVSGDHPDANTTVADLANSLGFAAVLLGDLATGGVMQQFPGGPLPALNLLLSHE